MSFSSSPTYFRIFQTRLSMLPMGLIQYYQISCQPVNQAICIFIFMPIVFCNLVSIKRICIIIEHPQINVVSQPGIEHGTLRFQNNYETHDATKAATLPKQVFFRI